MSERETFNNHTVYSLSDVAMSIHKMIERTYTRPYYIKAEILKLNYLTAAIVIRNWLSVREMS